MNDDEYEPTGSANFLERYRSARSSLSIPGRLSPSSSAPNSPNVQAKPPQSPKSAQSPKTVGSPAKDIWTRVFHPLGRSPKGASRYDLGQNSASPYGESISEIHAKGIAPIRLDRVSDE